MDKPPKKRNSTIRPCCGSRREFFERIIEHNQTYLPESTRSCRLIQYQFESDIAFGRALAAGLVDQYLTHQFRREGKKVSAVLKMYFFLLGKAQIGFMHRAVLCSV